MSMAQSYFQRRISNGVPEGVKGLPEQGTTALEESIMSDTMKERVEELIDYIMKKCLWQFHSRAWDRERQNKGIIDMTSKLLCGEPVNTDDPADRCYWVDAVMMARGFRRDYPWMEELGEEEIKTLMHKLKERLDFLTITGSLNEELNDPKY